MHVDIVMVILHINPIDVKGLRCAVRQKDDKISLPTLMLNEDCDLYDQCHHLFKLCTDIDPQWANIIPVRFYYVLEEKTVYLVYGTKLVPEIKLLNGLEWMDYETIMEQAANFVKGHFSIIQHTTSI